MSDKMYAFPYIKGQQHQGMTLRDYFAAKVVQGVMSIEATHRELTTTRLTAFQIAQASYSIADAMLEARK